MDQSLKKRTLSKSSISLITFLFPSWRQNQKLYWKLVVFYFMIFLINDKKNVFSQLFASKGLLEVCSICTTFACYQLPKLQTPTWLRLWRTSYISFRFSPTMKQKQTKSCVFMSEFTEKCVNKLNFLSNSSGHIFNFCQIMYFLPKKNSEIRRWS